jgi:hypothetical protein
MRQAAASLAEQLTTWSEPLAVPELALADVVPQRACVIEVGREDFTVGQMLFASGHPRYLALVRAATADSLARVHASYPNLGYRVVALEKPEQLVRNNAEVLIVSDPAFVLPKLRRHRYLRRLVWVVPPDMDARAASSLFASAVGADERGRPQLTGVCRLETGALAPRTALVADFPWPRKATARHYISPRLGVEGFLRILETEGVRYAVLRWFDELPDLPPGEDLDLLVDDEHAEQVRDILSGEPGLIPCDLYSVSGMPGTEYKGMAYYPPALAERILAGARKQTRGFRAPDPLGHFVSLAYHALYHKGEASGLQPRSQSPAASLEPEHDYASVLAGLAAELDLDVDITLEGLDDYLASHGWRPPVDTLGRLARKNPWIVGQLERLIPPGWEAYRGLAVFIIRKRAVDLGLGSRIVEQIRGAGFDVVEAVALGDEGVRALSRHARGGNWSTGPWPTSGGPPAMVVVAFDREPIAPTPAEREKHPGLENARVLVKSEIRDRVNDQLAPADRCNVIHSSDNTWGAREYLELALGDRAAEILGTVAGMRAALVTARPARTAAGEEMGDLQ